METQITSPILKYVSPAWPGRVAGVSIFLGTLVVFTMAPNIPWFVPAISFGMMLLAVFLSAETSVVANRASRTLTVTKKRIVSSSNVVYSFDDIAFICQNITTSVNQKGESVESVNYTLGLDSQTGTFSGYYRGRKPIPLPVPANAFTMLSQTVGDVQKLTHARELSNFIGVPLYVNGGQHDTIVNTMEVIPQYVKDLKNINISDTIAEAKNENERVAREILGDKYPNQ